MKGGRPEWIWSWQPKVAGKGTSGGVKSQQTNYKTKNGKLGSAVWTLEDPHHRPLFPDNQQTTRVPSRV